MVFLAQICITYTNLKFWITQFVQSVSFIISNHLICIGHLFYHEQALYLYRASPLTWKITLFVYGISFIMRLAAVMGYPGRWSNSMLLSCLAQGYDKRDTGILRLNYTEHKHQLQLICPFIHSQVLWMHQDPKCRCHCSQFQLLNMMLHPLLSWTSSALKCSLWHSERDREIAFTI